MCRSSRLLTGKVSRQWKQGYSTSVLAGKMSGPGGSIAWTWAVRASVCKSEAERKHGVEKGITTKLNNTVSAKCTELVRT